MYVRTWKDTDMVATSDSDPTGSTSDDKADPAPDAESTASSEATGSPGGAASQQTAPPAAPPAAAPSSSQPASSRPARTDTQTEPPNRSRGRRSGPSVSRDQVMSAVNGVRERLAALVWIIAVVFAVILAAAALLIALEANPRNDLVEQVVDWAGGLDGPFRDLFNFDGDNAVKKAALVNWGLAAVAWLVGGRIVSSIIRP